MKCWYQPIDSDAWKEGTVVNFTNGILFMSGSRGHREYAEDIYLRQPEVTINDSCMNVCGFQKRGDMHQFISVDVRFTKPKR